MLSLDSFVLWIILLLVCVAPCFYIQSQLCVSVADRNKIDIAFRHPKRRKKNSKEILISKKRFRGVKKRSSGKFTASIVMNGKTIRLGTFDTPFQAAMAYDRRCIELGRLEFRNFCTRGNMLSFVVF